MDTLEKSRAYDLLALDLDGTLLDRTSRVSARNRQALHALHGLGVRVLICTGRCFTETLDVINDIGLDLDAAVTSGGAVVTDIRTRRTLERSAIPLAAAQAAAAWLAARGLAYLWMYDAEQAGFDGFAIDGPRRHAAFDRWLSRTPCRMRAATAAPHDGCEPVRLSIVDESSVLEPLAAELAATFAGQFTMNVLRAPTYEVTLLEIFCAPVTKWHGVERLCRRWGIDPARTVAVGDDVNDIEMLRRAGLGVAMGNAHPPVKRVAARIVAAHDQDGVAELIESVFPQVAER